MKQETAMAFVYFCHCSRCQLSAVRSVICQIHWFPVHPWNIKALLHGKGNSYKTFGKWLDCIEEYEILNSEMIWHLITTSDRCSVTCWIYGWPVNPSWIFKWNRTNDSVCHLEVEIKPGRLDNPAKSRYCGVTLHWKLWTAYWIKFSHLDARAVRYLF